MKKVVSVYGHGLKLMAHAIGDVEVLLDSDEGTLIVHEEKTTTTLNWRHVVGYVETELPEGNNYHA